MKAFILSAGKSNRFSEAGCPVPKHLLPMPDGRKLIEWQEERMLYITNDVTTVVLHEHVNDVNKYIRGKLVSVARSNGPLDTFWRIAHLALTRQPIIVMYNDHIMRRDEYKLFTECSNWLEAAQVVFPSKSNRFNYVSNGFADGGVYKFRDGFTVWRAISKHHPPYTDKDGMYLLVKKCTARTYWVSSTHRDLGIPEDYKSWMAEQGCPVNDW